MKMHNHYEKEEDRILYDKLPHMEFLGIETDQLKKSESIKSYMVTLPTEEFIFLHEAAVIEYHNVLFAAWYNNEIDELKGRTPIRYSRSYDGGKTWEAPEIIADDVTGKILFCPPVFGICNDKLYMFINEMVSADHMHATDLYIYNEEEKSFSQLWSKPLPFKLNTNVVKLQNGKLMLPGRIAELDGFPNTPAVLISDSGEIDAEWRLVRMAENGDLPNGTEYEHPEQSAVVCDDKIYMFCRNDYSCIPTMYVSEDCAETWSGPYASDIPFSDSKIYSGTLSDGRNYVIGNLQPGRKKLAIFFSEPDSMKFSKGYILQNEFSEELNLGMYWHYPAACESDRKLYVVYTAGLGDTEGRGLCISVIDLDSI